MSFNARLRNHLERSAFRIEGWRLCEFEPQCVSN